MAKGETFSTSGYERKKLPELSKVAAILGILATTLTTSGCAEPTTETTSSSTAQEQESPTTDIKTDSNGNPDLDWKVVDKGCTNGADCEEGDLWGEETMAKTCDGTTLIYRYSGFKKGGIDVVPNSPQCSPASPTPESSPTPATAATPTPAG